MAGIETLWRKDAKMSLVPREEASAANLAPKYCGRGGLRTLGGGREDDYKDTAARKERMKTEHERKLQRGEILGEA